MNMEMKNGDSENDQKITPNESNNREKYGLIFIIILIIVALILLTLVLCFALKESDICLTKNCALTAATLISAIDKTVDPCEDFYEFACGNFIRKNPVPEGRVSFNSEELFNINFNLQLKDLIEGHNSYGEPNIVFKVQEMYHVCINTSYQPEKEFDAFRNFTVDILNWPLTEGQKWQPKYDTITDFIVHWEESGVGNKLFPINIHNDCDNDSKLTVQISANYLTLTVAITKEEIEQNFKGVNKTVAEKIFKAIKKFFYQFNRLLGNKDTDLAEQDWQMMSDLAQYAKQLSKQMKSNGSTEETMSIQELSDLTDNKIDWLKILNKQMRNLHTFTKYDIVEIIQPDLFRMFPLLLKKFPLRVFANINGWLTIIPKWTKLAGPLMQAVFDELMKTLKTEIMDWTERVQSPEEEQSRWHYCLDIAQRQSPMVVTRMFINRYIDRNDKASVDEMILWIQKAYKKRIQQSTWLDEETKKNALKKADTVRRYVAYPDFIFDDEALEKEYADFPEVHSTHFLNFLEFEVQNQLKHFSELVKKKPEEWSFDPLVVNAFYDPEYNSIWFPSGILQLPYFDSSRLAAVNFGMIGSVIGHELGHAFDDHGSNYDENGKEKNWWTNKTREIFEQKTQCYVDQYDAFCPEELQGSENDTKICISGKQTLADNLADTTGVIASFYAYQMWVKTHGKEKLLPGLQEYSPDQLFFISYGYSWCENIPVDKWVDLYQYDEHSPGKYRVNGPLSNSEDFRKAFKCPEGPMNRGKDSCTMW